ncbi:MAG: MerR family transcriptional regulator [Clostridia bacterium]|nr:MerR family transcriptional regulator [Clostridia bacterium]
MFRIGEFSKLSKTTIKALRYYDKVGLLKPAFVDPETAYRYYTGEQLETLRRILLYKSVGLSNAEVIQLLAEEDRPGRPRRRPAMKSSIRPIRILKSPTRPSKSPRTGRSRRP